MSKFPLKRSEFPLNFLWILWFLSEFPLNFLLKREMKRKEGSRIWYRWFSFFIFLLLLLSEVGALFSKTLTSDTLWVWIGRLYSNVNFLKNAFTRYSLACDDFFLEAQESFPGWTRRTFKKQEGEWMRRTGQFTGLHFLPSIRVSCTRKNTR